MVGSAIVRRLATEDCDVITVGRDVVDLKEPAAVQRLVAEIRPHAIFMAAAKVGGILANATCPADFLYENLMIAANVTEAAYRNGVAKIVADLKRLAPTELVADSSVSPGGCRVDTQFGSIDQQIEVQLDRIRDELTSGQ